MVSGVSVSLKILKLNGVGRGAKSEILSVTIVVDPTPTFEIKFPIAAVAVPK